MSASLQNEFISDTYTSLLHLSGGGLYTNPPRRDVYDGSGNITGFTLSGTQVIANNVALPEQHVEQKVDGEGNPQITSLIDMFFPIGSIQMTIDNVNPENRIPGTRWVPVAGGRFVVSAPSAADDGALVIQVMIMARIVQDTTPVARLDTCLKYLLLNRNFRNIHMYRRRTLGLVTL